MVDALLKEFCKELKKGWNNLPKKGHPQTTAVHKIITTIGTKHGWNKKKAGNSKLEFDLAKRNTAIELMWGQGEEIFKDVLKMTIDPDINALYIVGRYHPDKSMTGIIYGARQLGYVNDDLKKNKLMVYHIRIFLPNDPDINSPNG